MQNRHLSIYSLTQSPLCSLLSLFRPLDFGHPSSILIFFISVIISQVGIAREASSPQRYVCIFISTQEEGVFRKEKMHTYWAFGLATSLCSRTLKGTCGGSSYHCRIQLHHRPCWARKAEGQATSTPLVRALLLCKMQGNPRLWGQWGPRVGWMLSLD